MEIKKFKVPMASYPRYVYTADSATRMYKRFNVLLKTSELVQQEVPEYRDPDIYTISSQSRGQGLKESDLRVRNVKDKETTFETLLSVDQVQKEEELDKTTEKIVLVISDGLTDSIDMVKDFALNTVLICTSEEDRVFVTDKYRFIQESNVPIVKSSEAAKAIDAMLERIVFRKLLTLVNDLSQLKEVFKGQLIEDKVREKISGKVNGMVGKGSTYLKSISEELRSQDTNSPIPEDFSGNDEREHVYRVLEKMSIDFSKSFEQFIHGSYKELPMKMRELCPMCLDVDTILDVLQLEIRSFLVTFFPKDDENEDLDVDEISKTLQRKRKQLSEELVKLATSLRFVVEVDKRLRKIKEIYESSFHRLSWEIKAMYNRSKVPKEERPSSDNESKSLSPKVAKRLFDQVNVAVGTGYRCDKLHVYVRANSDVDEEKVRSSIKKVLGEFHITEFEMITSKETRHFKRVGARIQVARKGTLGGFAWMHYDKSSEHDGKVSKHGGKEEKQLCALLSKHVVNGANRVYWIPSEQDEQIIQIGSIIQVDGLDADQVETPSVDVAAARILSDQQQSCERQFKNSEREASQCQLYDFTNTKYLEGLRVHICGASTRLGIGTITEPEHFVRVPDRQGEEFVLRYVVIEDIEPIEDDGRVIKRFCTTGDSGGVICADTPDGEYVHVISMLIGSLNYQEVDRNPELIGRYISFRMTDGLMKLKQETGNTFSLCSD